MMVLSVGLIPIVIFVVVVELIGRIVVFHLHLVELDVKSITKHSC